MNPPIRYAPTLLIITLYTFSLFISFLQSLLILFSTYISEFIIIIILVNIFISLGNAPEYSLTHPEESKHLFHTFTSSSRLLAITQMGGLTIKLDQALHCAGNPLFLSDSPALWNNYFSPYSCSLDLSLLLSAVDFVSYFIAKTHAHQIKTSSSSCGV